MVDTLFHMSHQFGNQRMFAPEVIRDIGMGAIALGEIIDPYSNLMNCLEMKMQGRLVWGLLITVQTYQLVF